ncbi:MAG: phosphate ABC transporter substrate-binding protein [Porticoccaceae bacterium]|nr:phosphate ABC transporter substrate-binding protein [Porticoccaceae bacterium]
MNPYKRYKGLFQLTLLAICFAVANVQAEMVVVVAADSSVSSLTRNEVAKIFLGKTRRFPDGSRAIPLNQSEGNAIRKAFYRQVSGKSAAQVKAHWAKLIFTGRGQPPKETSNDDKVKRLLNKNTVNIAYIDLASVDDSVKVVPLK